MATFSDALSSISNASTRDAAKRGVMGGYIWAFRTAKNTLPALTDKGDYRLSFVQRDGDQFIYTWDESAKSFAYNGKVAHGTNNALDNDSAPSSSTALELGAELLLHIGVGSDWTTGAQADFEGSRSGSGEW